MVVSCCRKCADFLSISSIRVSISGIVVQRSSFQGYVGDHALYLRNSSRSMGDARARMSSWVIQPSSSSQLRVLPGIGYIQGECVHRYLTSARPSYWLKISGTGGKWSSRDKGEKDEGYAKSWTLTLWSELILISVADKRLCVPFGCKRFLLGDRIRRIRRTHGSVEYSVTLVYNPRSVVNDQGADPLSAP